MNEKKDYLIHQLDLEPGPALANCKVPAKADLWKLYAPIEKLYQDFNADAEAWQEKLSNFTELVPASEDVFNAALECRRMYLNLTERMQQFTFVFIGQGDVGKTSLLCDLSGMSPAQLNAILERRAGFDPADRVKIHKGAATCQIYDFHFAKLNLRLIDFPGHSGLVHRNRDLARMLELADCQVYVLSAATSLSKSDVEFLSDQVALIDKDNPFQQQPGADRTIILAWNRWLTEYEKHSEAAVDREWRKTSEYTLNGRPGEFPGLAELFSSPIYTIKVNSRRRDEDGEVFPGEELYVEELTRLISEISSRDGVTVRLKRPLQLMSRTLSELENNLLYQRLKTLPRGEDVFQCVVDDLRSRSEAVAADNRMRLAGLCKELTPPMIQAFQRAADRWTPPSSFLASLKTIIPIPALRCGPEAVTKEIADKWAASFREVFAAEIEESGIGKRLESALLGHADSIINALQPDLSGLSEQDLERVSASLQRAMDGPKKGGHPGTRRLRSGDGAFEDIAEQMNSLVKTAVESTLKEQLGIMTGGLLLDLILAKLTLGLTTAFAACVRWFRSTKQDESAKLQVQQEGADAIRKVMAKLATELTVVYDAMRLEIERQILVVINVETETKEERRKVLLSVIQEIDALKKRVADTYQKEVLGSAA